MNVSTEVRSTKIHSKEALLWALTSLCYSLIFWLAHCFWVLSLGNCVFGNVVILELYPFFWPWNCWKNCREHCLIRPYLFVFFPLDMACLISYALLKSDGARFLLLALVIELQYYGSYHACLVCSIQITTKSSNYSTVVAIMHWWSLFFNLVLASKRAGYEEILKYYSICSKLQDILAFIDI